MEEDGERLTMTLFQTMETETRKRMRLLFFFIISSPFPCLFLSPVSFSLVSKTISSSSFFFSIRPLSAPFLYFVSLSKLLSTSPKSPPSFVSPSSLCLSSKSCPPSISGSPPVFIGSRGEGHPTLSKRRVRWRGAAFA